ncbi:MAG TPA: CopG family ribbon-helix-helix protein [Geminicoccaceae bacterium]
MSTQTLTLSIAGDLVEALDRLAAATGRPRDELAEEAIRDLLDYEAWKEAKIQRAIEQADRGDLVPHEEVFRWLESWGSDEELPPPLKR